MREYTSNGFVESRMLELGLNTIDTELIYHLRQFFCSGKAKNIMVDTRNIDGNIVKKPFYYITYSKIIEDCPILGIKTDRGIRQLIYKYEKIGLVERYKQKPNSTLLYLSFNWDVLERQEQFIEVIGEDKTLAKYVKNKIINQKIIPLIRFSRFEFIYSNAGISNVEINMYGKNDFYFLVKNKLKKLLSEVVFDLLKFSGLKVTTKGIELNIDCNITTIKMNQFKIEEAIVSAYKQIMRS